MPYFYISIFPRPAAHSPDSTGFWFSFLEKRTLPGNPGWGGAAGGRCLPEPACTADNFPEGPDATRTPGGALLGKAGSNHHPNRRCGTEARPASPHTAPVVTDQMGDGAGRQDGRGLPACLVCRLPRKWLVPTWTRTRRRTHPREGGGVLARVPRGSCPPGSCRKVRSTSCLRKKPDCAETKRPGAAESCT